MEDYKEEIRNLILAYYHPNGEDKALYKSTTEILQMCQGIIPNQPITQHEIYEVMKELGFNIEQVIIMEKKIIYEGDEAKGIPAEYDEVEKERLFLWTLYEKDSHTIRITP